MTEWDSGYWTGVVIAMVGFTIARFLHRLF